MSKPREHPDEAPAKTEGEPFVPDPGEGVLEAISAVEAQLAGLKQAAARRKQLEENLLEREHALDERERGMVAEVEAREQALGEKEAALEARVADLKRDLEVIEQERTSLEMQRQEVRAQHEQRESELEALGAELAARRDDFSAQESELAARQASIEGEMSRLEALQADTRERSSKIEARPQELELAEARPPHQAGQRGERLAVMEASERRATAGVCDGDKLAAPPAAAPVVRGSAMVDVDGPYDLVVTTNGGYPLDQNLCQSVEGMSAADQIVREGGTIIIAAACPDGLPDHGRYTALLAEAGSPQGVLDMSARAGLSQQDQWQVQIQAMIQLRADVHVYSDGLTDEQIQRALLAPCRNIEHTVARLQTAYGPETRICVMPEGPQTIAYLRNNTLWGGFP